MKTSQWYQLFLFLPVYQASFAPEPFNVLEADLHVRFTEDGKIEISGVELHAISLVKKAYADPFLLFRVSSKGEVYACSTYSWTEGYEGEFDKNDEWHAKSTQEILDKHIKPAIIPGLKNLLAHLKKKTLYCWQNLEEELKDHLVKNGLLDKKETQKAKPEAQESERKNASKEVSKC